MQLRSPSRSRLLAACVLGAAGLLCLRAGIGANAILCLAPALALGAILGLRRYPGERILTALRQRGGPRRARPGAAARTSAGRLASVIPRGGLLLACSLAVRPPPAPLAAS